MKSKYLEQTDRLARITLSSSILVANWSRRLTVPGGQVGFEIFTNFVGNNSNIEIELSDQTGKIFSKHREKISGNHFWTRIKVPPDAKQALYATVKLPKHGLQMKSNPLILLPPIEITNAKWDKKEARRGDILKLSADVTGAFEGMEGEIEIWEYDSDGAHDFISKFPVLVKNNKVEAEWEYEYHEDTDDIPTEKELNKYGNKYNPPEYFFRVKVGEVASDSGLLEFKDWIEIKLKTSSGTPLSNKKCILNLPDGKEKNITLDDQGYAREENLPPGPITIRFET